MMNMSLQDLKIHFKWHGFHHEKKKGYYTITRTELRLLMDEFSFEEVGISYAGHALSENGYYPQYILEADLK